MVTQNLLTDGSPNTTARASLPPLSRSFKTIYCAIMGGVRLPAQKTMRWPAGALCLSIRRLAAWFLNKKQADFGSQPHVRAPFLQQLINVGGVESFLAGRLEIFACGGTNFCGGFYG